MLRPSSSTVSARKWTKIKWSAVLSPSFYYLIFVRCEPVATYSLMIPFQGKLKIYIILTARAWITSDSAIGAYVISNTISLPSKNSLRFMPRNPFAVHCLRRKFKWPSKVTIIWTRCWGRGRNHCWRGWYWRWRCAADTPAWKGVCVMIVANYALDPVELEEWKIGKMKSDHKWIMF